MKGRNIMTDDLVLYASGTAVCILRCSLVEGFWRSVFGPFFF